jgi:hypothetical protein
VVLQADFSDQPDDIPELIKRIESGADLVLADYRRRPGLPRLETLARRLVSVLARRRPASAALEHVGTLKAMRLVTLARVLSARGNRPLLERDGWAADVELLRAVAAEARRVEVVPVTSTPPPRRRASRSRPLRSAWQVWQMLRRPAADGKPKPPHPRRHGGSRGPAAATVPTS